MTDENEAREPAPSHPAQAVEPCPKAPATRRIAPRPIWPRPETIARLHPALWVVRVVVALAEPFLLFARVIRYVMEEPRYASAPRGRVTIRRSLVEGLGIESLWHPHQRIFGGFAWGADDDLQALAHAVLTDYLGAPPPEHLCAPFSRRAFVRVARARDPWTLTTLQVEQALRLALMDLDSAQPAGTMAA